MNEIAKAYQRFNLLLEHWVADFYHQTKAWEEIKCLAATKEKTMEQVLAATAMYDAAEDKCRKALNSAE